MSTSGTSAFDLDFTDIAEEAWERAGRECAQAMICVQLAGQ